MIAFLLLRTCTDKFEGGSGARMNKETNMFKFVSVIIYYMINNM